MKPRSCICGYCGARFASLIDFDAHLFQNHGSVPGEAINLAMMKPRRTPRSKAR